MKKFFVMAAVAAMVMACGPKNAEDYVKAIEAAAEKGDTAKMHQLYDEWEQKAKEDSAAYTPNEDQQKRILEATEKAMKALEKEEKK